MSIPIASARSARLLLAAVAVAVMGLQSHTAQRSRRIQYSDLPVKIQQRFSDVAETGETFEKYLEEIDAETTRRIAEGDREHLIHYALQSGRFTDRAPIEPALSAKAFVEGLSPEQRARLLAEPPIVPRRHLPAAERARIRDLLSALRKPSTDARLEYIRSIVQSDDDFLADSWYPDYVRAARFLYRKEFLSEQKPQQIAELYHDRPHSSDTQIDAGFAVYIGLGIAHSLEPSRRIRRVLVIGPGLDLAPRTDLIDAADPQSYQPLALADALLGLSMAFEADLRVHSVDVNPRVVRAVQALARGVTWHLFSGITGTATQSFSTDYRAYLRQLGRSIGGEVKAPPAIAADRHYVHSIAVRPSITRTLSADRLNVITERITDEPFDLIIATNVLTYFDDRQLSLGLVNIAAMLRPGGYLLHNESRDSLAALASLVGLPAVQMRSAMLGGLKSRPLFDVIWLHQK